MTRRLMALGAGLAMVEAALLVGLHATWAVGMAPQVVAPAPFGVFHDLRWLVVYHPSLPAFFFEFAALVLFRSTVDAVMVREAWPATASTPRPSWGQAWRRTLFFTVISAVLLAPWVVLLFGLAVVSLSWLFFSAIPPVLAVAVLTNGGPVSGDWWRRTVPLKAVGWMALTFAVMTACGGITSTHPMELGIPVAGLGGLFNAFAWRGVVGAVTSERHSRRFAPVAPAGLAILLAVVVGGSEIGFAVASTRSHNARVHAQVAAAEAVRPAQGAPLLIAAGFGTKWDGRSGPWLPGPFDETRFSYRGLDPSGRPVPYGADDTMVSLSSLDASMATQVDALAARTRQRVSIVAVSEATLVAETYLESHPKAPVRNLVLLSPLVAAGRVYYPPAGRDGWGVVGGFGLDALADALGGFSPLKLSPSTPLFRSIETDAPAIRQLAACAPPGVHQVAVEPVADAVATPGDVSLGIPTVVVPAFHSGALGNPASDQAIERFLATGRVAGSTTWADVDHVIGPASAAWQVPALALSLNPAWSLTPPSSTANCSSARRGLAGP